MARMIVSDREYVTKKYKLHKLKEVRLSRRFFLTPTTH